MVDLSQSDDFHDSNLLAIDLDFANCLIICRLEAYLSAQEPRSRTLIKLEFRNVRSFSATADLGELHRNAMFGNIAHWIPSRGFNFISLAAGAISFEAGEFHASIEEPILK